MIVGMLTTGSGWIWDAPFAENACRSGTGVRAAGFRVPLSKPSGRLFPGSAVVVLGGGTPLAKVDG
jgi:hypothetical protein